MLTEVPAVGRCWCGCGRQTADTKLFMAGHDKAAEAAVIREDYGTVAAFLLVHGRTPFGPVVRFHPVWTPTSIQAREALDGIVDSIPFAITGTFELSRHMWGRERIRPDVVWMQEIIDAGIRLAGQFDDAPGVDAVERYRLDELRTAGDWPGLETRLIDVVTARPGAVDAWVELGHLCLGYATAQLDLDARRQIIETAYGFFEAGVVVAEEALPSRFGGVISYNWPPNRAYLSALRGLATAAWHLDDRDTALEIVTSVLWLDPEDRLEMAPALEGSAEPFALVT